MKQYRENILELRKEMLQRSILMNIAHEQANGLKQMTGIVWWKNHAHYDMDHKEIIFYEV